MFVKVTHFFDHSVQRWRYKSQAIIVHKSQAILINCSIVSKSGLMSFAPTPMCVYPYKFICRHKNVHTKHHTAPSESSRYVVEAGDGAVAWSALILVVDVSTSLYLKPIWSYLHWIKTCHLSSCSHIFGEVGEYILGHVWFDSDSLSAVRSMLEHDLLCKWLVADCKLYPWATELT